MTIVNVDLDKLNEALAFAQEQMKPMSARVALRMVQEAIIPPAPPKDAPKADLAVLDSAEAEEGATNG